MAILLRRTPMRSLFSFLLLAVFLSSAAAQDEGRKIRFRTLCFAIAPGADEVTVSGDPTLDSKVTIKLGRRLDSAQHEIVVMSRKVLLGELVINPEGKPAIEPIAVATLPSSGNQFLFFLVPTGNREGEIYRCLVLSDDSKNFPPGAFRMVNMSGTKLRFAMGEERFELPNGAIKIIDKIRGARADGRFAYVAQYKDGDAWNRLSTGFWHRHDKIRFLQIAFLDPRLQRLRMRGYNDTLPIANAARKRREE